ncbi:MAG: NfeD family protein [Prevotella sp.]|nr:NfeD family protein [Prevotella sp.]
MLTFFSTNLWLLWLIVSLTCLVIELSSGDFYFICFSLGALVSIIFAACDAPFIAQLLSWVIASVLCLVFVRPSLVKRLHNRKERKSNADALIGRSGKVTTTIPADGYGYVQIDGDQWRSLSADGTEIPVGTIVSVVSRDSIILTVR